MEKKGGQSLLSEQTEGEYLSAVNEFGQGDIGVVTKDVEVLEVSIGSILEPDAEEVADIGGRAAAELNGNDRGELS